MLLYNSRQFLILEFIVLLSRIDNFVENDQIFELFDQFALPDQFRLLLRAIELTSNDFLDENIPQENNKRR